MKFSKKDDEDLIRLNEIINRVYTADVEYFDLAGDKMYANQPYVIEFYLSYRDEISLEALGEVIKMSHVVWEYFYTNEQVKYEKITDEQATVFCKKNHQMLKYFEGELAIGQGKSTFESREFNRGYVNILLPNYNR
jgi:hypothetical protein